VTEALLLLSCKYSNKNTCVTVCKLPTDRKTDRIIYLSYFHMSGYVHRPVLLHFIKLKCREKYIFELNRDELQYRFDI